MPWQLQAVKLQRIASAAIATQQRPTPIRPSVTSVLARRSTPNHPGVPEARFGTANEALADALITSALATIRPEFGGGEGPAPLGPARYTVARKILVNGTKISVELSDL